MIRGDIYWADDVPGGRRPVVVITRDGALNVLSSIMVAPVTTRHIDIASRVPVGPDHGLRDDSQINCDAIATVRKAMLTEPIGRLDPDAQRRLDNALRFALGLDETTP